VKEKNCLYTEMFFSTIYTVDKSLHFYFCKNRVTERKHYTFTSIQKESESVNLSKALYLGQDTLLL